MIAARFRTAWLVLTLTVATAGVGHAGETPVLDGAVLKPIKLTEATLRGLPKTELDVTFETSKGAETGHYVGVLLWPLLEQAGLADTAGKNPGLRHTILVTGSDGYAAAIAFGEIDPHFANKSVILAYEGGTPPASFQSLRLVVPGDSHGGRSVKDVVRIDVK